MGRTANMSALGLFTFDKTLFDLLIVPDGISKDTLIDNILAETAELEILYSNPTVLKNLIGVWSAKEIDVWKKLLETTKYDYNPIDNYNRIEEGTDTGRNTTVHGGADTRTLGGTDRSQSTDQLSGTDTTSTSYNDAHYVAGFDSATVGTDDGLAKQTKDIGSGSSSTQYGKKDTMNGSVSYGKVDTLRHGEQVVSENEGGHKLHAHGNIGVTTTQQLIREEREIDRFNLYDIIIESFKMRFCILVY